MNPAPPKPPSKTADRKALAAYYSELRRWARSLEQWEADLDEREAAFDDEYEMDCECDDEAAAAGCDCPKCDNRRLGWILAAKDDQPMNTKVLDEVKHLEALWKLEDKRK